MDLNKISEFAPNLQTRCGIELTESFTALLCIDDFDFTGNQPPDKTTLVVIERDFIHFKMAVLIQQVFEYA
jgi:hypothetical protein